MADDEASPSKAESDEKPTKDEDKEDDMPTALIPKSLLAGKKFDVGEEVVFRIVHTYDDEVEIEYATGKGKKDDSTDMDSEEMSSSMKSMDEAMA